MEHVRVERATTASRSSRSSTLERRNAMTAQMVDEIVATFDRLEADGTTAAVVDHRRGARILLGRRRVEPRRARPRRDRRASGARSRRSTKGSCRVLRSPLPDGRGRERPGGRRGHEPRARVRRAHRRHARPASTPASCKIGLHPGGGHTWMLERAVGPQAAAAMVLFGDADRREPGRGDRARLVVRHPTTSSLDRGPRPRGRAPRASRSPLLAAARQTLRQAPWQPDFEAAIADRGRAPGLVTRPGLVPAPDAAKHHLIGVACTASVHATTVRWSSLTSASGEELGDEFVAALLPLLDGDRVADVVLVHALDLQEPHRDAFVAEAELLGDAPARRVARARSRLRAGAAAARRTRTA